tara:strand:- start:931 stop:1395 length:465 start_codon:yes stop_codon:yes gene_type:complete
MATKWHPASGKWGIFGETSGSEEARKATERIDETISDIEGRREGLSSFYKQMGDMQTEQIRSQSLSDIEKFLTESYNIRKESEERKGRTGFAFTADPEVDTRQQMLRTQTQNILEDAEFRKRTSDLNLAQRRQTDLFALEDLIRNLQLERESYS